MSKKATVTVSDHIEPDFADAIYEFACKLPQTIRPDILAFVVVYATGKFNEGDDVLPRHKTFPSPRMSCLSRFVATLCTIAALDYVLQRAASTTKQCHPMLRALAEQTQN